MHYSSKAVSPDKQNQKTDTLYLLCVLAVAVWALIVVSAWFSSAPWLYGPKLRVESGNTPTLEEILPAAPAGIAGVSTQPTPDYAIPPVTNGMAPVISRIPTSRKVAFLTIDDGIVTNPNDVQVMQAAQMKATFFLVYRFINGDWQFFQNLAAQTGSDIENHSYDHYLLTNLSYDQQKVDICKNADAFAAWFGARPVIFRPSGGAYNAATQKAAADCGMKAIVLWDGAINNGVIRYQNGNKLQPGDIILMHFRTTFQEDLAAFTKAAHDAGLQPALLVNWLS